MPHGRRVKNLNFKNKCSKEKEGARCLAVFAAAESHTLRSRICTILRLISTSVRLIEQYKTTLTQQENVWEGVWYVEEGGRERMNELGTPSIKQLHNTISPRLANRWIGKSFFMCWFMAMAKKIETLEEQSLNVRSIITTKRWLLKQGWMFIKPEIVARSLPFKMLSKWNWFFYMDHWYYSRYFWLFS
jgi:hypothetical protein